MYQKTRKTEKNQGLKISAVVIYGALINDGCNARVELGGDRQCVAVSCGMEGARGAHCLSG